MVKPVIKYGIACIMSWSVIPAMYEAGYRQRGYYSIDGVIVMLALLPVVAMMIDQMIREMKGSYKRGVGKDVIDKEMNKTTYDKRIQ